MTRTLGLADGFAFWWKAKRKTFGEIRATRWNTSFRLRPHTTDYDTYEHVFVLREYDFPIPFEPELILDGGANIGMSALYFARRFPGAKIIAIEPDAANYALLEHNIRDIPKVECIQGGLWSASGHLRIKDKSADANSYQVEWTDHPSSDTMKALSIGEILKNSGRKTLDLVKLDIEGAEREIFRTDYASWLPHTRLLIVELHDRTIPGCSKALFEAMANYDFSCETRWENLIFFNRAL
ncbi:MAG: FkbM family methyltransferase [Bacteroidetes bacterium]|nr:FkbM family methyltransferase [Bacteroidota bacterium]